MLSCGALLIAENEDAFLHLDLEDLSEEAEDDVMFDTGMIFGSVEEAVKELHSFSIQRCGSHSLALAIADSFDEYSITILENARRVVKKLRTANVTKILVQKGLPKAILNVSTRWDSTFDMLDCLLKLKSACIELDGVIPQLHLSADAWSAMEDLHESMKPAHMATNRLQSAKITAGDLLAEFELLITVNVLCNECFEVCVFRFMNL